MQREIAGPVLAVSSALPSGVDAQVPIVLVHGAANSAKVWSFWQHELAANGWASHAIDLRGHGQSGPCALSSTTMQHYATDVRSVIKQLVQPPVVLGWSMGGLIAMMVAATGDALACIALAPSRPAQRVDTSVILRNGEFGPEEYGITGSELEALTAMPDLDREERNIALASGSRESRLARDERRAGIVVESLPCPLLIITGTADTQWPKDRYDGLWLKAEYQEVEGASHWGLVLNRRAVASTMPMILNWLSANAV